MKIIIDEREKSLYDKCYSIIHTEGNTTSIQLIKRVIPLGDILIHTDEDKPVAIIERKSLTDLLASIKDGRYEEQSHRLVHAGEMHTHNIVYLVEGMTSQLRSILEKKMVYSAIASLHFFKGFSVFRTASIQESAEMLVWMANKIDRDLTKGKAPAFLNPALPQPNDVNEPTGPENAIVEGGTAVPPGYAQFVKKVKSDNITPQNMGEIMLCQIPGISALSAAAIMKHFDSFPKMLVELEKTPDCLNKVTLDAPNGKSRKISKTIIENIFKYLSIARP